MLHTMQCSVQRLSSQHYMLVDKQLLVHIGKLTYNHMLQLVEDTQHQLCSLGGFVNSSKHGLK